MIKQEIIPEANFLSFSTGVVQNISPYRKWNREEMQAAIKYYISRWIDNFVLHGKITSYKLEVDKIGQTTFKINLTYSHGWANTIETISLHADRLTRSQAAHEINKTMTFLIAEEIKKNRNDKNGMTELLINKLTNENIK